MKLLFVHGWSNNAAIWDETANRLPSYDFDRIDFGYFGPEKIVDTDDEPVIAVGHSLGVLWLLTQYSGPLKGLVSIAGFDNFAAHINPTLIQAMQMGLMRRPERTLQDFWQRCGGGPTVDLADANIERLNAGLDALQKWDGRERHLNLNVPILALAARDDQVVHEQMSKAIWEPEILRWVNEGTHSLPLTKPDWCADEIDKFAKNI